MKRISSAEAEDNCKYLKYCIFILNNDKRFTERTYLLKIDQGCLYNPIFGIHISNRYSPIKDDR